MGTFVIKRQVNNQFMFNLVAPNGQVILTSEGYMSKHGCAMGIESVRQNCSLNYRYNRLLGNGGYYFTLTGGNGEVIGVSEMYGSVAGRENGIESVMANGRFSPIFDNS